jgi:hypothetical protein
MGSTHPYYRAKRPAPQVEREFQWDVSLTWVIRRLVQNGTIPAGTKITGSYLLGRFQPSPAKSLRFALTKMLVRAGLSPYIDLANAHLDPYRPKDTPDGETIGGADRLFDKRAAAAIYAAVNPPRGVRIYPNIKWDPDPYLVDDNLGGRADDPAGILFSDMDLLEQKIYGDTAPKVFNPLFKCLAAMAYGDYFP